MKFYDDICGSIVVRAARSLPLGVVENGVHLIYYILAGAVSLSLQTRSRELGQWNSDILNITTYSTVHPGPGNNLVSCNDILASIIDFSIFLSLYISSKGRNENAIGQHKSHK